MSDQAKLVGYDKLKKFVDHEQATAEVQNVYDDWAASYEQDTSQHGYAAVKPSVDKLLAVMQAEGLSKDEHVMDVGAGTGLVAEVLISCGCTTIDALDISQEMLNIAKEKGLYKQLFCENLGEGILPIADKKYSVVTAVGCFTFGHIKATGFDEVLRITKPGGLILFTIREDVLKNKSLGYEEKINDLKEKKAWEVLVNELIDYHLQCDRPELRYASLFICKKVQQ